METGTTAKANPDQLTDDDRNLLRSVRDRFASYVGPDGGNGITLFTTDSPDLWELFLDAIPQELRQVYTCNACRKFVERFGGLVAINAAGVQHSVMWGDGPGVFQRAVDVLSNRVEKARITGVFVSGEPRWGTPVTGPWSHFGVTPPPKMVWKDRAKAANERAAELREEFGILRRSLAEYPVEVIRNAHNLLTTGQLYRSEKCVGVAEWALNLHNTIAARPDRLVREATTWLAAATAPPGFCHMKTTVISSLLDNIVAGKPFAEIKAEFDAMMAPSRYQRAQTPPAAANVEQAEAIVARLGIARSLLRRYARRDEVVSLWEPIPVKGTAPKPDAAEATPGVFAHLKTKETAAPPAIVEANATTMTWDKFQRTILPGAIRVEAQVPTSTDRFAALVTAVDFDAPPILQWDRADARNPVSWYYAAGIDAEIKRRVIGAGAQYDNVDIRASLIWNNRNDLDLHVITPRGEHIFFASTRSTCGGWLDVDMNVRGETTTPVENIRWQRGRAQDGLYRVYVQNYAFHERKEAETPFRVELEVAGEVFQFDGIMPRVSGPASDMAIASFLYVGNRLGNMTPALTAARASGAASWNLTHGEWATVSAIAQSPNMWGDLPMAQHGEHLFFLLQGCRDTEQGIGRGFFVETLRSELREVRSTLEAYTASTPIAGVEEANACGLGMVKGRPWDLTLRVTRASGTNIYKLDRWD